MVECKFKGFCPYIYNKEDRYLIICREGMDTVGDRTEPKCSIYYTMEILAKLSIEVGKCVTMKQLTEIVKVYKATMDKLGEALNKIDIRLKALERKF